MYGLNEIAMPTLLTFPRARSKGREKVGIFVGIINHSIALKYWII